MRCSMDPISKARAMALVAVAWLGLGSDAEQAVKHTEPSLGAFLGDSSAQMNMASRVVGLVVSLTVGGLIAAFLLPIAIDELVAVDTSSWGSGAESLWEILDVIVVLAVFLFFIGIALAASSRLN